MGNFISSLLQVQPPAPPPASLPVSLPVPPPVPPPVPLPVPPPVSDLFQASINDRGDTIVIYIMFGTGGISIKTSSDNFELTNKKSMTFKVIVEERMLDPVCRDVEPRYTLRTTTVHIGDSWTIPTECSHAFDCDCKVDFDLEALAMQARACGYLVTTDTDGSSVTVSHSSGTA